MHDPASTATASTTVHSATTENMLFVSEIAKALNGDMISYRIIKITITTTKINNNYCYVMKGKKNYAYQNVRCRIRIF